MTMFRSALYNLFFYGLTVAMVILCLPLMLLPRPVTMRAMDLWARMQLAMLSLLCGTRYKVIGHEHVPDGACILAAKHQSAWDTFIFHALVPDPAMVLKRELMLIPLYGWWAAKARMIAVDRKAGAKALRRMLNAAEQAVADKRQIVIFPQGTRVAPGTKAPYQPGIMALYRDLNVPVVPVALNSGLFWPRRKFLRRPGTITLEFLPAIAPGLKRQEFMSILEERIESATARLEQNAGL